MVERREERVAKQLGEILIDGAFISREELEAALDTARKSNRKLGEVLVEQGLISQETLATILSFQLNIPIIDLRQFKVQPEAVALVPDQMAIEHNILPLAVDGDTLTVAMDTPENLQLIDTLAALTRKRIKPVIPLNINIRDAINTHYRLITRIAEEISEVVGQAARPVAEPIFAPEVISQAPIVRAVEMLLTQAVKDRASDIHLEPQKDKLRVRYRIDGILHEAVSLPLGVHAAIVSRIKVMANMNIAERRRPQDGQFSATIGGRQVDFRVATIEGDHGELLTLRVLDKSLSFLELGELGMSSRDIGIYEKLLKSPFGMILISGPTGCGKTTTLYASISKLDSMGSNIMTIEDPIEYRFEGINQIQVNRQAGITFATGLRAIMRLDPDIIMVGEIRDAETANTAIQAALTGHLVLTSIHGNDAVGALLRLVDLGVEPFLVTSAVIATLSQRLVRKVCPYCRAMRAASAEEVMAYQQEMGEVRTEFQYGRGCNFCSHSGYLGRTAVFEILSMTEGVRKLVLQGAPGAELKARALEDGMTSMRHHGMLKARDGVTTPMEVIRNVFTIG